MCTSSQFEVMNLFITVNLGRCEVGSDPEGPFAADQFVVVPNREGQLTALVGTTKATMQRITMSNETGPPRTMAVFAFPDLSVRQEGDYYLIFDLFEIVDGCAHHRGTTTSHKFTVFPAK